MAHKENMKGIPIEITAGHPALPYQQAKEQAQSKIAMTRVRATSTRCAALGVVTWNSLALWHLSKMMDSPKILVQAQAMIEAYRQEMRLLTRERKPSALAASCKKKIGDMGRVPRQGNGLMPARGEPSS